MRGVVTIGFIVGRVGLAVSIVVGQGIAQKKFCTVLLPSWFTGLWKPHVSYIGCGVGYSCVVAYKNPIIFCIVVTAGVLRDTWECVQPFKNELLVLQCPTLFFMTL